MTLINGGVNARYSNIYLVKSIDVRWSDISLADAEVCLFKRVLDAGDYGRIHLLSGADLPLRSQDEIHSFFRNCKEEFIDVRQPDRFKKRLRYYHFFVRSRRNRPVVDFMRRLLLIPQLPFVDRLRHSPLDYAYGSEWCSLTYEAVKEIVVGYSLHRDMFRHTTCCDEHYKQMILKTKGYVFAKEGCLRFVMFDEGCPSPKTLKIGDLQLIQDSGCLFARKFDINEDREVVERVLAIG